MFGRLSGRYGIKKLKRHMSPDQKLLTAIQNRWSPRAFAGEAVPRAELRLLFEAARWAASAGNEQPWRFIVASKDQPEEFDKLLDVLVEGNQVWARGAPVLALSFAKRTSGSGRANNWNKHDTGMALANLMLQATAMDLVVHAMAGFDGDKACSTFNVPDDFDVVAAFAIGRKGAPELLPDKLREREVAPRSRKPLEELVWEGTFGNPARLLGSETTKPTG